MAIKTPKIYTKSQWNRLSKQRKAVIVAADTIQWIKSGKFTPKRGVYCQLSDKIVEKPHDIRHVKNDCIGCAKGGLFYSKCMANNELDRSNLKVDYEFETKDFTTYFDPSNSLTDCFTEDELAQIEEYFEGWVRTLDFYNGEEDWCLLFICLHIIKNRGQVKLAELNERTAIKFHNEVVLPYVRRNRSLWRVLSKLTIVEFME
jgi:hypothetical protein